MGLQHIAAVTCLRMGLGGWGCRCGEASAMILDEPHNHMLHIRGVAIRSKGRAHRMTPFVALGWHARTDRRGNGGGGRPVCAAASGKHVAHGNGGGRVCVGGCAAYQWLPAVEQWPASAAIFKGATAMAIGQACLPLPVLLLCLLSVVRLRRLAGWLGGGEGSRFNVF